MADEPIHDVVLTIPAKPEYVALCRLVLAGIGRDQALDEEVLADLKLAVTEACSNAVRHARGTEAGEGTVEIRYRFSPDEVGIEVLDAGTGFELDHVPEPGEEPSESGMGIAIIAALTDRLEVAPGPLGQGSCIRFTRSLREARDEQGRPPG